jgi:peptidoglycan/LPS O-acetylase OafA/YrhL
MAERLKTILSCVPMTPIAAERSAHRLDSLDGLRFVSCCLIVLYHFVPYIDGKDSLLFWPLRNAAVMVDVFFIISGVVIAYNYAEKVSTLAGFGDFLKRRIARLYPLHLATLMFYVAIGVAVLSGHLHVVKEQKYDFGELLPNLMMIHAWGFSDRLAFNGASWSISAEMFAYLCFPLLLALISRSLSSSASTLIFLYAAGIYIAEHYVGRRLTGLTIPYSIFRALPSFALGVAIYRHCDRLPQFGARRLRTLVTAAFAIFAYSIVAGADSYVVLAAASAFTVAVFLADRENVPTLLSSLVLMSKAKLTYSMYMLHGLIATVFFSFLFPKLLGSSFDAIWVRAVCVALGFGLTIAVSAVSYAWFETPARRTINQLGLPGLKAVSSP